MYSPQPTTHHIDIQIVLTEGGGLPSPGGTQSATSNHTPKLYSGIYTYICTQHTKGKKSHIKFSSSWSSSRQVLARSLWWQQQNEQEERGWCQTDVLEQVLVVADFCITHTWSNAEWPLYVQWVSFLKRIMSERQVEEYCRRDLGQYHHGSKNF